MPVTVVPTRYEYTCLYQCVENSQCFSTVSNPGQGVCVCVGGGGGGGGGVYAWAGYEANVCTCDN